MLRKYLLIILLFPFILSAQDNRKTFLVVPLVKKNVTVKGEALSCLKYNKVSPDSLANDIYKITLAELKTVFRGDSMHFIKEYISPSALDSAYSLKLHDRFYINQKDSSYHLTGTKLMATGSYHNIYYSCDLNERGKEMLKKAIQDSKCDYVLFINEFEIIKPNSTFSLSCEVMGNNMKLIFGDKNEALKEVDNTMFYDVMKYYVKQSEDEMLKKIKNYLSN